MSKKYMYKVSRLYQPEIKKIEVTRFTEKTVWFDDISWNDTSIERREAISTEYHKWFHSFVAAKNWIIQLTDRRMDAANKKVLEARAEIERVKNLEEATV